MKPYFFGSSQQPLFGVYHPARSGSLRPGGIVICQPFGSEYLRAHRSLRELAHRLAEAGFPVLRFDYYGCGDSGGASETGHVERWLEDIVAAIEEVREASGTSKVALVGLRLGATLAALVGSQREDVDRLVLWEPIVSGEQYLGELAQRHRAFFEGRPKPRDLRESDPPQELLGFAVPPRLRETLARLDLRRLARRPARRILLLGNQADPIDRLSEHLTWLGARPDYEKISGARVWVREAELNQAVVPQTVLEKITAWFDESHA